MSVDPNDPQLCAALDAYRRGDLNKAAKVFESLLADHPAEIFLLQNLAAVEVQRRNIDKATIHLDNTLKIEPKNIEVLSQLGQIHKKTGRRIEAQQYYQKAVDLDPNIAESQLHLGELCLAHGDAEEARACFEKAIAINPDFVDALVKFASLCEHEHRLEESYSLAQRAATLAPGDGRAAITLTLIEVRTGKAREAVQRLEHMLKTASIAKLQAAHAHYVIGNALHKQGDFDNAFAAYKAANATLHQVYEARIASMSSVLAPQSLQRLHEFFAAEDVSSWTKPQKTEGPAPVFLLGFPRSGTTLLDQILSAHSSVVTLEEKENMIDIRNELVKPSGALEKLRTMTDSEINVYRKKYWMRAQENFHVESPNGLVIDKMPLNTILLGLIYRLFPEAKVIFALRDPRDVVLSCFQQRFGINAAMFQFLRLESAAAYYDQVMSIAEVCRTRMPLNLHIVRYEDVIGDMKTTISGVLSFLELEWQDGILDYRGVARNRWISTPSAEQVIEPLHTASIGKWRNYQSHLEPVLPMLELWVKKYGYEAF